MGGFQRQRQTLQILYATVTAGVARSFRARKQLKAALWEAEREKRCGASSWAHREATINAHSSAQLRRNVRASLRSWRSFPQPLSCRYDHEQKLPHGRSQARTPDCPHRDLRAAPRGPQTAGSRPTRAHGGRKGPRRAGKCRKASRRTERCRTALVESSPLSSAMVRALPLCRRRRPPAPPLSPRPSAHSSRCERGRHWLIHRRRFKSDFKSDLICSFSVLFKSDLISFLPYRPPEPGGESAVRQRQLAARCLATAVG